MKNLKLQFKIKKQFLNQAGISVLLAIIVLTSLMVMTVAVFDLVFRAGKSSQEIGQSEVAYYAAETAVEKALYEIEYNRNVSGLDNVSDSLDTVSGASWERALEPVVAANPWQVDIAPGESFQLELDFEDVSNVLNYPSSLTVNWTGNLKVVVFDKNNNQSVETSLFTLNNLATNLYTIRVVNESGAMATLILSSSGDLPMGIRLTGTGSYQGEERVVEVERTNWQIY